MGTPAMSRGNLLACKMTSYFDGSEDTLHAGFPHARNNRIVKFPQRSLCLKSLPKAPPFLTITKTAKRTILKQDQGNGRVHRLAGNVAVVPRLQLRCARATPQLN